MSIFYRIIARVFAYSYTNLFVFQNSTLILNIYYLFIYTYAYTYFLLISIAFNLFTIAFHYNLIFAVLPPNEKKSINKDWIIQFLSDIQWSKYLHEPKFQTELKTILNELQNYTHTSAISPSQIQQIALKHEDIYKFMNHVSWQIHHKQSRKYVLLCFFFLFIIVFIYLLRFLSHF